MEVGREGRGVGTLGEESGTGEGAEGGKEGK